jgi:23S rRNA (adenine2503-C2)-methyltransferase
MDHLRAEEYVQTRSGVNMATLQQALSSEDGRTDLRRFDRAGLATFLAARVGADEGDALRIYKQLWQRGVERIADLDGTRRELRRALEAVATISRLEVDRVLESADGTRKFLWRLPDGHVIESVLIPDADRDGPDRLTLCMSSQVGCAMACTFCLTGDLGLVRHLTAAEIALQPLEVRRRLRPGQRVTNLVLMGMGEPIHNLANLLPALRTCLDDHGLGFSHRRVTVSTVGLVPKMAELAAALPVNLAVSLNATTEEQRREIMPITKRYPLAELLEACRRFPLPTGKRITFEYVMIAGFNDTPADAARLVVLLQGIPSKVNLIPYNENPDRPALRRPDAATVRAFRARLTEGGASATVRATRGLDISAACGQLGGSNLAAGG